jgi:hypothetical protein
MSTILNSGLSWFGIDQLSFLKNNKMKMKEMIKEYQIYYAKMDDEKALRLFENKAFRPEVTELIDKKGNKYNYYTLKNNKKDNEN